MQGIPRHVALIMDGNRRWAEERSLPIFEGHREGEKRIEPIVDRAMELEVDCLTFWALSTENWRRSKEEIEFLLDLFRENLNRKVSSFHKKNVKVNVIGNLAMFPEDIQKMVKAWAEKTKDNNRITVNMALSYGGRDEIVRAVNKLVDSRQSTAGRGKITEAEFAQYLDTAGQPDPDMVIRTGRQKRLSGFLPWQSVYSELYFTDVLWPDFSVEEFEKAIEWYREQKRNFGT